MFALATGLLAMASPMSAKSAMQAYVEAMQPGWNLGNTLDATPTETSWGNPLVTQELIQQIAAHGFKSIRIPITWDAGNNRLGPAPTYTIDPAFLDRVQQIVDWSLDAGLYVMINMHHDSYWVRSMPANHDTVLAKFNAIWTQVAPRFRDYSNKLMFESINEPTFDGVDGTTKAALLNELNTSFHDIVRGTGGGNATRPLVLPSVETNSAQEYLDSLSNTMAQWNDPNLIATVHYYGFWPFSVNIAGVTTVNDAVINDINATVNNTYNTFIAKGVPVIVGELGLLSYGGANLSPERGEVLKFFETFTAATREKGLTWQLWDAGQLLDRTTYQWKDVDLVAYCMQGLTTRSSTAQSDLVFLRDGTPVQDAVINLNLNGNSFLSLNNGATPLSVGSDYMINGSVLTLKASMLAQYASGAYGQKALLTANFDAGLPWKFYVRYATAPVVSAATGTKTASSGLVIPVAFNGDLLANMEAQYVASPGYPYPGQASWTAFQGFGDAYQPDYYNNNITINKNFFDATTNDPIEVSFHMWSGRTLNYRLTFQPGGNIVANPQEWSIYSDSLSTWNNWGSWATNDPTETTVVHSGTAAISVDAGPWGALVLGYNPWEPAVDTSAFKTLVFWINGGSVGGQKLGVGVGWGLPWIQIPAPQANTWTKVEILLSDIGAGGKADITNFMIQDWSGAGAPTFYVDDIKLTTAYPSNIVFVSGTPAPVITSSTLASGVFNTPFSYTITAINNPVSYSATGLPPGLTIDPTTGVISGTPTAAGIYQVSLGASNDAGVGPESLAITIHPAPLSITLGGGSPFGGAIRFAYDGAPQSVAGNVTTAPAGVPVTITYDGSNTPPKLPGSYDVVVTSQDPNYTGVIQGTLEITVTALVRHGPTLSGDIDGSLQLLNGDSFTVSPSTLVSGDLLVPGTPTVLVNGQVVTTGIVVNAGGNVAPSNYNVALTKGASVRYVIRRVDPLALPVVTAPATPAGTRSVTLTSAGQSIGSSATLLNLTLSASAGAVTVPAGVYGNFAVNGSNTLVLGVEGATVPAVYQLQSLTIAHNASVKIVGPVTIKLASSLSLDGPLGSTVHPDWLELQIALGGLTVNGGAVVNGVVTVPNGAVLLNGTIHGRVNADRLTISGSGVLEDAGL